MAKGIKSAYMLLAGLLVVISCERKANVVMSDTVSTSSVSSARDSIVRQPNGDTGVARVKKDTLSLPRNQPARPATNITVEFPKPAERISAPIFPVHGMSRTFENSVSYKLLSQSGATIANGHGMSHGSMGQFGPYDFVVNTNGYIGKATLQVFDLSPKDGKEIDKVSVPVVIARDTIGIAPSDRLPTKGTSGEK
jgi:hypothetical protein